MKIVIRSAAEEDILRQIEFYAEQAAPLVARRFRDALMSAFSTLQPEDGAPKFLVHGRLAGLRLWPVRGFAAFRIYYLVDAEYLTIVRVLHARRDILDVLQGRQD